VTFETDDNYLIQFEMKNTVCTALTTNEDSMQVVRGGWIVTATFIATLFWPLYSRCPSGSLWWSQSCLLFFGIPSVSDYSEPCVCVLTDESDEEDEGRPSRRRRLGERAAEGADDDEEVGVISDAS